MDSYYPTVTKLLKDAGYQKVPSGKGSHEKWKNGNHTAIVPHGLKSKHTANSILKDAGIAQKI